MACLLTATVITLVATGTWVGTRERETVAAIEAAASAQRVADEIDSGLVDVVRWASGYADDPTGLTRAAIERSLEDLARAMDRAGENGIVVGPFEGVLPSIRTHVSRLIDAVGERQILDADATTSFDLLEAHLIDVLDRPWDRSPDQAAAASRSLASLAAVRGNLAAYRRLGDEARVPMMQSALRELSAAVTDLESAHGIAAEVSHIDAVVDGLVRAETTIRSELDGLARLEAEGGGRVADEIRPAIEGSLVAQARRSQSALDVARWIQLAVVLVLGIAAWIGARRMRARVIEPIAGLVRTATRAASGDLTAPEPVDAPAEIRQLGEALRDLIERRRSIEHELSVSRDALAAQNGRLQELDRLKSEFVASASHELRNPLTTILAFAEELDAGTAGALNDEQARFVAAIKQAGQRLRLSVADLLHLGADDAGGFRIVPGGFDLSVLIEEVCVGLGAVAAKRGIEIVRMGTDRSIPVVADRDRLGQVLDNLINNAVKFSSANGRVHVGVRVSGAMVSIDVKDQGKGIDPEALPHLFDRFYRAPSSASSVVGSGIGLAVVKSIVEAHGGSVAAESRPEGGALFTAHLPIVERVVSRAV